MFKKEVYINRRKRLHEAMNDGIVLILGNSDSPMNYPGNIYEFRQDSTFLYFFGLDHPDYAAVLDLDSGEDMIFGNDIDIDDIIWMGPQPALADLAAEVGVQKTAAFAKLYDYVKEAVAKGRKVHFLPPYRAHNKLILEELTGIKAANLKEAASVELIKAIVPIRNVKDEYEIAHIEEIMDVAYEMHTTAMRMAVEGVYERQIAGTIEGIAMQHGGRVSFPVILSKRGETLHNHDHSNLLKTGDLLLVDAGFESPMHYATDHTRTFPVGGSFSPKQREIYEIVLAANNAVHANVKAGVEYREMHFLAARTIAQGLKELGLMKGDVEEAVRAGAHALFMPHGLGHMMGLDVHDMEDYGETYVGYAEGQERSTQFGTAYLRLARELKPGYVFTNEPGIYFIPALIDKWQNEKINNDFINFDKVNQYRDFGGIRLEDDILITADGGSRNLGKRRIPITPEELAEVIGK
jgi:Xaa-Pro aminopeptidase